MILAILDKEEDFLYGITSYFQEKLGKAFDVYSFHTKETLTAFVKETKKDIDVYLGSTELDVLEIKELHIKQTVYLEQGEGAREWKGEIIYKYQAAECIMKEFMAVCRFSKEVSCTGIAANTKLLGVYSPVGRCGKTSLALVIGQLLAQNYKVIYVNLEEWPGFERVIGTYEGMDVSDLIYYIKQEAKELGMYINAMLTEINQLKILPPVKMAPDIQELGEEEINRLLQEIVKSDSYDVIVIDFGRQVKSMFPVLEKLERLYMPVLKDVVSQAKQEQFLQFLTNSAYAESEKKIKQCRFKFTEQMECGTPEELYYGSLGVYAAELLKEEGLWNIKTESEIL